MLPFYRHLLAVCPLIVLVAATACLPEEANSRFTVNAPLPMYRFQISRHVRESALWQTYLDYLSAQQAGDGPVISIDVVFEREVTGTGSGDYDPGIVYADLEVTNLQSGTILRTDRDELEIPNHVIVREDATREEVQDAAFAAVEEKAVRFVRYSLDLAVIRAMSEEGRRGKAFLPILQETHENHWSTELAREAEAALRSIQGD